MGFIVGALIMLVWSYNPITAYTYMFQGALGTPLELGETLREMTPLVFTAIGFAVADKAGFLILDYLVKHRQDG